MSCHAMPCHGAYNAAAQPVNPTCTSHCHDPQPHSDVDITHILTYQSTALKWQIRAKMYPRSGAIQSSEIVPSNQLELARGPQSACITRHSEPAHYLGTGNAAPCSHQYGDAAMISLALFCCGCAATLGSGIKKGGRVNQQLVPALSPVLAGGFVLPHLPSNPFTLIDLDHMGLVGWKGHRHVGYDASGGLVNGVWSAIHLSNTARTHCMAYAGTPATAGCGWLLAGASTLLAAATDFWQAGFNDRDRAARRAMHLWHGAQNTARQCDFQ